MTSVIYKYPLTLNDRQTVELPLGAEVLCAQAQYDTIMVWAKVDPQRYKEPRTFYVVATGAAVPEDAVTYLSTVQLFGGRLVFHVYLSFTSTEIEQLP